MSSQEATNILFLLKALQQDMADVHDRITALELNDKCMTRIEQHLSLLPLPDISSNIQNSDILIDPPVIPNSVETNLTSQSINLSSQTPLNILPPSFTPSSPAKAPISASSTVTISSCSSSSSVPSTVSSPTHTRDEIQAINVKHSAIENNLHMLSNFISGFIESITSYSSSSNSASAAGSN
ncbi:hypothetical protein RclHR1_22850002 [Rhizophagus clarus]|uniref:Uncharacterized protein n=1 Tax=Rhizophagus clarus TaxID=94130 RepID=A0A2Z6RAT0_9GLOM|nr:hypothetical protein RclHR1_22850002 [Rhizophagus clarus]GES85913.1 hypothetical protein RCL_jg26792.t1 [Rhizophagus clarus]